MASVENTRLCDALIRHRASVTSRVNGDGHTALHRVGMSDTVHRLLRSD